MLKKNSGHTKRPKVKKYSVIVIPEGRSKVWRWEISRRQIETGLALVLTFVFITTGSIWGFAHYREGYLATENIRLQNAEFDQERGELLQKLANLEMVVQKTERLANRVEGAVGVNGETMQKGIGPITEGEFTEPVAVKQFDAMKFGEKNQKLALKDLKLSMDSIEDTVGAVEDRLHTVYERQKDKATYWASIPSIQPARGYMTSDFGPRRVPIRGGTSFHEGIDIAAPAGTPVMAPGDGVVTFSGYKHGLGNCIIVDHGYGVSSTYGHLSANNVNEGDRVKRGEMIGAVGRTGVATGSHLHYQVEVDGAPVDPMRYIHSHM